MTLACPRPFKVRSRQLEQSANGQTCTLRLPGLCLHDARVVLVHLPASRMIGRGTGTKVNDLHSCYGCQACHDAVDGRNLHHGLGDALILDAMLRALSETQHRMVEAGLILVKGYNA